MAEGSERDFYQTHIKTPKGQEETRNSQAKESDLDNTLKNERQGTVISFQDITVPVLFYRK